MSLNYIKVTYHRSMAFSSKDTV